MLEWNFPWCTPGEGFLESRKVYFCLLIGPLELKCKSYRETEKLIFPPRGSDGEMFKGDVWGFSREFMRTV